VASANVIGTVAYLDGVGYFSGVPGQAVLGGTTPWAAYLQVAIASSLGALDESSTPAQTQCLATFEIAQGGTNAFAAVLEGDFSKGICDHPSALASSRFHPRPLSSSQPIALPTRCRHFVQRASRCPAKPAYAIGGPVIGPTCTGGGRDI